jgi:hypothetical protein
MITWIDLKNSLWLSGFLLVISIALFLLAYGSAYVWYERAITSSGAKAALRVGLLGGLPLGFAGLVAGFLTGSSRSPAVSALVPAILTFTGLIVAYMIGKGQVRGNIAGFSIFVFSAQLLVGTVLGSASRDRHEEDLASVRVREFKADQEFKVRLYCKGLGLITDVSKPCPVGVVPPAKESGVD